MGRVPAQRGFTLIELLVTIIIAGIAFAALTPVFVQAFTTGSSEKARLAALNVAQDRIEKIRQLDYDQITQSTLASDFGDDWTADQGRGRHYDISYWVKESSNTKQVFVTVDWEAPPRRAPDTFAHSFDYSAAEGHGFGVTLSTVIYRQYGGAQVIDLEMSPDTSSGLLTWEFDYPLDLIVQAVINPLDDNPTTAYRAEFKAFGANDTLVLDEKVSSRDAASGRFQIAWTPATDGLADGIYRFEVTVYSAGGFPGNSYAEEFRLESGRPIAAQALKAHAGNMVVWLTWVASPSADVTSYEVWRSDGLGESDFSRIATGVGDTSYTDTQVQNGNDYQYYVVAVDGAGKTSNRTAKVIASPAPQDDVHPPPSPVVTAALVGKLVTLTWPDVADQVVADQVTSGTDHYVVTRDDGIVKSIVSLQTPGRTVTFTDTVTSSHRYSVVAWDLAGNSSDPAVVEITYIAPRYDLTVSANKNNVTFSVRDSGGNVVATTTSNSAVTWSLNEGDYSVIAVNNKGVVRGPQSVTLDADKTLPAFVF
jgi:prepilin-type N-terminal cleavage/methylation domain-containing protein